MRRRTGSVRIGTFNAEGLYISSGEYLELTPPTTVIEAWSIAERHDIRQLWMGAEAVVAMGLPVDLDSPRAQSHPFLVSGSLRSPSSQTVLSPWLTYWSGDGERRLLEIAFPSWDRGSPFNACSVFAPWLAGEVGEFNERTGMLWRRNGQTTSDSWLRDNVKHLAPTDRPEPGDDGNLEPDLKYVRELDDRERRSRFVHAFDANAMYLGAASSLSLPVGACEFIKFDTTSDYVGTIPGYWNTGARWVTSPTLSLWRSLNTPTVLHECYVWRDSHRFLEGWYRSLRNARNELIELGPSPALDAVKATYQRGIGQLASHRKKQGDALYQPYWRHAIQAEARSRLQRRIAELSIDPIAVDVDCLYFATNSPDALKTAERIGLPIGNSIGQFKVTGTARGKTVRAILADNRGASALSPLRNEVAA